MSESEKVAIGRVVLRTKQYLAAIRPAAGALALSTMLFADEVVPADRLEGLPGEDVEAGDREAKMARQLIESLSTDFDASRFRDEYRDRVLHLIEQKAEGKAVVSAPQEKEPAGVVDLMAALEASLAEAKSRKGGSTKAAAAKGGSSKGSDDDGAKADNADGNGDGAAKRPRRRKAPSTS